MTQTPTTTAAATEQVAEFTATIRQDTSPGGWTIVVMPESGEFFGTRRPVRVEGELDGHPFEATLLPMGDGTHMVPIKAALRKLVGKGGGEQVVVRLRRRTH
ncbi:MAG TPA: DUF1905 domain-containing protein [Propionibacteriaceae bacterium]